MTLDDWPLFTEEEWPNYIFDTTGWVSHSLAPTTKHCYRSVLEGWQWGRLKDD